MSARTERRQDALVSTAGAAQVATGILIGTVMAVYVGERASPLAVGMVATAYFAGSILFAPVWGAVADVTGRRRALLVATAGMATMSVLPLIVVRGVWGPIGLRATYAVFASGFLPIILTIVSTRGGAESRGRSIGKFTSFRAVGFTAALLGSGALLSLFSYSTIYLIISTASLITVLAVLYVHDPTLSPETDPSAGELLGEIRRRMFPAVGNRDHLTSNGLHWVYVALVLRNASWQGVASLLPVYLILHVGTTEFAMGVLLALSPATEILGMYVFGRAADRIGRKPLIVGGVAAHGLVGVILAAATFPNTLAMSQALSASGLLLKGIGFSALVAGTVAFIGDVAPIEYESQLMGLRSTARGIGGALGPISIGGIATVVSFEVAFVVAGLLAVVGMASVWAFSTESYPPEGTVRTGRAAAGN